jgi:hypothetical protein
LNNKYKTFFHHTQMGGHLSRGLEKSEKSCIASVMKTFFWELLFISGEAKNNFTFTVTEDNSS